MPVKDTTSVPVPLKVFGPRGFTGSTGPTGPTAGPTGSTGSTGPFVNAVLPTASHGLSSGTWWNNSGVVNIIP